MLCDVSYVTFVTVITRLDVVVLTQSRIFFSKYEQMATP